ncbi:MAG: cupin [Rhodospirillaceae bacterium]|nr:cupin [Rhodospirillaceae bacterium]|tara:strand:+ start:111 stop:653 length:543 start_codon:yes stop_codon:yes gene_type:complete
MGIRRVITGHDGSGKAIVISDKEASNIVRPEHRPGVAIHNLWRIDSTPANVYGEEDTTTETIGLLPPENGCVFRIIEFPPEKGWIENIDDSAAKTAWASIGAEHVRDTSGKPPHPLMHRTETVDFALCLEGQIHMVLDDSEVLIKKGDVVIQRGTNHAWSNRTDTVCKMMFVLIDGTFEN